MKMQTIKLSRRNALIGGAAVAAMIPAASKAQLAPVIQSGGGIAGGGSIVLENGGTASFSVFGSRFEVEGQNSPAFFGSFSLVDSGDQEITSTDITNYAPVDGDDTSRDMTGLATLNGDGPYAFSLRMTDSGFPGGSDRLSLTLQPAETAATPSAAVEAIYSLDGALETGDLQLITFEFAE